VIVARNNQEAESYKVGGTLAELPKDLPRSKEVNVTLGDPANPVRPQDNS
jgi:hypothetical protein